MLKKILSCSPMAVMILPFVASAQASRSVDALLVYIQERIGQIIPILIGLALVLFLWGILRYLFSKDDIAKAEARSFMMWGIVALFVMVSVWGLVGILQNFIFGGSGSYNPTNTPGFGN